MLLTFLGDFFSNLFKKSMMLLVPESFVSFSTFFHSEAIFVPSATQYFKTGAIHTLEYHNTKRQPIYNTIDSAWIKHNSHWLQRGYLSLKNFQIFTKMGISRCRSETLVLLMILRALPLILMGSEFHQVSLGPGTVGYWTHTTPTVKNSSHSGFQHVQGE